MTISLTRSRPSGWLLFLVSGAIWLVYNVGGNWVGLDFILDWIDSRNGGMAIPALLQTDTAQLSIAVLASSGQAWLQSSREARSDFWLSRILLAIMAADFALNLVGVYVFTMPAVWPPDVAVLGAYAIVTLFGNILLQSVAHTTLNDLLKPQQPRHDAPVEELTVSPMTRRKRARRAL